LSWQSPAVVLRVISAKRLPNAIHAGKWTEHLDEGLRALADTG